MDLHDRAQPGRRPYGKGTLHIPSSRSNLIGPLEDHRHSNCGMPHHSSLLARPNTIGFSRTATFCPPTPHIPFRPLPGYPINYDPHTPDLFPILLSQPGLSSVQTSQLSDLIPAFTTISVRDTSNRVLCNVKTGSMIMATTDFVQFLQHFVCHGLPSYASLSPPVQQSVEVNFVYRHGAHGHDMWDRFVRGIPRFGGPTGLDLILGNTVLWLLDFDVSGVWIAIVDVPRSPYSLW
ncbi:hypothetical protein C8R44DRAFT_768249 [Mycena epipterygia]|nr:hypothetical protein C8R44DRAFT_768249 [Mycena epipterygia]